MLLLAYRDGLSDERAMKALRFDLRWKLALDLPVDHPGFHPTTLVRFRARLLLHGKERLVFQRSLCLAKELGLLDESPEQIVDDADARRRGGPGHRLARARWRAQAVDAVTSCDQHAAGELEPGLCFDYARPREKSEGDWRDKVAREALLGEVATDAERALRAVEQDDDMIDDDAIAEAAKLLREIVGQEFEVSDDEVPRVRRGRRIRQVISAHDPSCVTAERRSRSDLPATSSTPRPTPKRHCRSRSRRPTSATANTRGR